MRKLLVIGAVIVALFFGAKMFTQSSESTPQMAQKTDDKESFFSSFAFASAKKLTPAQKKLEELGFYPDRFQSVQVKNKSTK